MIGGGLDGPRRAAPRRLLLAAVAILAVAAGGGLGRAGGGFALVVEDAGRLRLLHAERVTAGQAFVLSYVHSSERVPVRGTFRIEADGSLIATETRFAGFGPGLPALGPGDRWRMEDGMIVALTATRLPELRLRVVPIAQYRLVTPSGREIDLSGAVGPGGPVRIRAITASAVAVGKFTERVAPQSQTGPAGGQGRRWPRGSALDAPRASCRPG